MSINFGKLEVIDVETSDIIELVNTYNANFEVLRNVIDNVTYTAMTATTSTNPTSPVELGSTVDSITLSWTYNKSVCQSQSVNGETLPTSVRSKVFSGPITSTKNFTLNFSDKYKSYSKTHSFQFVNGIYYGVNSNTEVDSDLIRTMTKKLQSSRGTTFTVNASSSQYIYYCLPTSYGKPVFKVGGFEGGFNKISTIQYTNIHGHTESYDIWRSANKGLGNTTVSVS